MMNFLFYKTWTHNLECGDKSAGATDIALTELGHTQEKELGERIKAEGIHIDKILYSPLMRAADTAKHIAEVTGVPAEEEMRLREQNSGRYESTREMVRNFLLPRRSLSTAMMVESPC